MIGVYKLKSESRFRVGVSSFGLDAGAKVEVTQVDSARRKVLLQFDERTVDWFDESILERFYKVPLSAEEIRSQFLARSIGVQAILDAETLERFDKAGLGTHPKLLAMIEQLCNPGVYGFCRKAKAQAYRLLRSAELKTA